MDLHEFRKSLSEGVPPADLDVALLALWHVSRNDWHRAHELVQEDPSPEAAWVHAHLHRVEGDLANADYWYRRAGRDRPPGGTSEEIWDIAGALLRGD